MERLRWRAQWWYTAEEIAACGDAWPKLVGGHAEGCAIAAEYHKATQGEGLQPGETFRFVLRLDMHALTPEDVELLALYDAAERERLETDDGDC